MKEQTTNGLIQMFALQTEHSVFFNRWSSVPASDDNILGSSPFLPPPPPALLTKLLFPPPPPPPLADMLSWAAWFKFLLNKVIANTCLLILTSFSKQSASWKVLEICELCALSTDSRKTYSVNKYMYTGSSSYSYDWGGGGIIRWGGGGERNGKDPYSVSFINAEDNSSLYRCP